MNRGQKWIIGTAIGFIGAGSIIIGSLPTLLSQSRGKETFLGIVNSQIKGNITIRELSLSWFGEQKIEGFHLIDPSGETVVSIEKFESQASLWSLLWGNREVGSTLLTGLKVKIEEDAAGETNIEKALVSKEDSSKGDSSLKNRSDLMTSSEPLKAITLPFIGQFTLADGEIRLSREGIPPVIIRNLNTQLSIPSRQGPLSLTFSGETEQSGSKGMIDIALTMRGFDHHGKIELLTTAGSIPRLADGGALIGTIKIEQLPTMVLDRLGSLNRTFTYGLVQEIFGETINASQQITWEGETLSSLSVLKSPRVTASIEGKTESGRFLLSSPGKIEAIATPNLLKFFGITELSLKSPMNITVGIDAFSFPLNDPNADLNSLLLSTQFTASPSQIVLHPSEKSIELNKMVGALAFHPARKSRSFEVTIEGTEGSKPISLSGKGVTRTDSDSSQVEFTAVDFPVGLIDELAGLNGLATEVIGSKITANIQGSKEPKLPIVMSIDLSSPNLTAKKSRIAIRENEIEWEHTVESEPIQFQLKRGLLTKFGAGEFEAFLPEKIQLAISIEKFRAPREFDANKVSATARVRIQEATFSNLPQIGDLAIQNGEFFLTNDSSKGGKFQADANATILNPENPIRLAVGDTSRLQAKGDLKLFDDGLFALENLKVSFASNQLETTFQSKISKDRVVTLTNPFTVDYTLVPEAMLKLGWINPKTPSPTSITRIHFEIEPFTFPLDGSDYSMIRLKGKTAVDRMEVESKQASLYAEITELTSRFDLSLDGKRGEIHFDAKSRLSKEQDKYHKMSGNAVVTNWLDKEELNNQSMGSDLHFVFEQFPMPLLETVSGMSGLTTLTGSALHLEWNSVLTGLHSPKGTIDFLLTGERLQFTGAFGLDKSITLSKSPAKLKWKIDPTRYVALREILLEKGLAGKRLREVDLMEEGTLELALHNLNIPSVKPGNPLPYDKIAFNTTFSLAPFVLYDKQYDQVTKLDQFYAKIDSNGLSKQIAFDSKVEGHVEKLPTSFTLKGDINELFTVNGELNEKKASIDLTGQVNQFPVTVLSTMLNLGDESEKILDAMFGGTLVANANVKLREMQGPMSLTIQSNNGTASIAAYAGNGKITLTQPAEAKLKVNEKLSAELLQFLNPIFKSVTSSGEPIRLKIEPTGFSIPIDPFNLSEAKIGKGTVELGKLQAKRQSNYLDAILEISSQLFQQKKLFDSELVDVWFTPQYFSVKDGVLTMERMDALIDGKYHFCTWGNPGLDLKNQTINMRFGITKDTLENQYGIKNLKDEYVMSTAIKGPLSNVKINEKDIAGRLLALKTVNLDKTLGSILGGQLLKDPKAPKPTTNPFPWGELKKSDKVKEQEKKAASDQTDPKEGEKKKKDPKKDLKKSLFDLIK